MTSGSSAPDNDASTRTGISREVRLAVLTAIVGLSGTILGATLSGYFAGAAADRQIAAEQVKSKVEAIRDQRREAYTKFLLANQDIQHTANEAVGLIVEDPQKWANPLPTADQVIAVRDKLESQRGALEAAAGSVALVGSPDTDRAAQCQDDRFYQYSNSIYATYRWALSTPQDTASYAGHSREVQAVSEEVVRGAQAFIRVARRDLDVEPAPATTSLPPGPGCPS